MSAGLRFAVDWVFVDESSPTAELVHASAVDMAHWGGETL